MSIKTYELADKSTGFFDRETGAQVVGKGQLTVDTKARMGQRTLRTIRAGGLIEVNRKSKSEPSDSDSEGGSAADSDIPQDFPSREHLIAGGFDSLDKVSAASDEELVALKGIGKKAVEHIREALK